MMRQILRNAAALAPVAALFVSATALWSGAAFADNLQCNKKQTRCLSESKDLTVGDKVGVFNDDGELVATGQVRSLRGERRAVLIKRRHGAIENGYSLALLETQSSDVSLGAATNYRVYREPKTIVAGASVGYSTVSIGTGATGVETSVYGQYRLWREVKLVGRGTYQAIEGEVRHDVGDRYDDLPFSADNIGLLGGVAYIMRETKPWSVRTEAAVGLMYVNATIDGDAGMVDEEGSNANVENGFAPAGRWSLGLMWNLGSWHLNADLAQSLVHRAFTNTLAFGAAMDVK
jgi:hypothetical protein